jgi:hypothetical protein
MTHNDLDRDTDGKWLADAKAGDFSTLPFPFTWDQSVVFAHIIDGYGVAGGVSECMEIAENAINSEPDPNNRAGSAIALWVALFGEHRRWRHFGYPPDGQDLLYLDALCEALRERLQNLSPDDRDRLLAVIAEHPGYSMNEGS